MKKSRGAMHIVGAVAVLGALLSLALWRSDLPSRALRQRPSILLVTFDTTRADRIGVYGWRRARTPAIDGLAAEGVLFRRAYASVPMTLPSHATIMTGLYPFHHGVRDNDGFELDESARTLAEILRAQGYQTGAVTAAFVLDSGFGLDQGFDTYRDEISPKSEFAQFQIPERNAQKIVDDAIGWLSTIEKDRPFFLWCHFYDPHHPYHTPEKFPFYLSHPYDQEIAFTDFHLERLLDHLDAAHTDDRAPLVVMTADHGEALGEYGEDTHAYFAYDSTLHVPLVIRLPDGAGAGRQIDAPVSLADLMPTLLDLAGLPVPGEDEIHGRSLVGLIRAEPDATDAFEERPIYFESRAPMYGFGWAPVRGVRVGSIKYIDSPEPELYLLDESPREDGKRNAHRQHPDLASRYRSILQDVVAAPLQSPRLSGRVKSPDPEVIQKLRALGYLAGDFTEETEWTEKDDLKKRLPLYGVIMSALSSIGSGDIAHGTRLLLGALREDPENPRGLWLLAVAAATNPVEAMEGLPVLEAASLNPRIDSTTRAALSMNCGRAYLMLKNPTRALIFFENTLELEGDNPAYLGWLGTAYIHLGKLEAALDATRRAVDRAPQIGSLQVQLGLLLFAVGQSDAGARTWSKALIGKSGPLTVWQIATMCSQDREIVAATFERLSQAAADKSLAAPVRAALHATLGRIRLEDGRFRSALADLEAAGSLLPPDDPSSLLWRARAMVALGRIDGARPLLEKAYRQGQPDIEVIVDLAKIRHQMGDSADSVAILSDYYDTYPEDPTAANNLAWMLTEQAEPDLDRALELAKFAVKRRVASAPFYDTLGWVHLKRNDGESAVFAFSRAARLSPENAEYQYHLGLAHRLDGDAARAKRAFAAAVKLAPTRRPPWFEEARSGASPGDT